LGSSRWHGCQRVTVTVCERAGPRVPRAVAGPGPGGLSGPIFKALRKTGVNLASHGRAKRRAESPGPVLYSIIFGKFHVASSIRVCEMPGQSLSELFNNWASLSERQTHSGRGCGRPRLFRSPSHWHICQCSCRIHSKGSEFVPAAWPTRARTRPLSERPGPA
jgi:hypothetical protein